MTLPYFTHFTMPDGTTRRPLFERCEEMRHDKIERSNCQDDRMLPAVAALCRCAVEDWLFANRTTCISHYGPSWVIRKLNGSFANPDDWHGIEHIGALHEALVHAAHTELDVQGVER